MSSLGNRIQTEHEGKGARDTLWEAMAFKEWTEDNSANETDGKTVTEVGAGTNGPGVREDPRRRGLSRLLCVLRALYTVGIHKNVWSWSGDEF